MKVTLIFGIVCLVVIASQASEETTTPKQGGFRNWLKGQLGMSTTTPTTTTTSTTTTTPRPTGFRNWLKGQVGITTTTTAKPNAINRAHSIYHETKENLKLINDPKALAAKIISSAIQGG